MADIPKDWGKGCFRTLKTKRGWAVICPQGEKIVLGFNASVDEDEAQATFIAHACNVGLLAFNLAQPLKSEICWRCKGTGEITELAGHNVSDCITLPCPVCQ